MSIVSSRVLNFYWYLIMETLSLNSALVVTLISIKVSLVFFLSIFSGYTVCVEVSDTERFQFKAKD